MQPSSGAALIGILLRLERRRRRRQISYGTYIRLRKLILSEFMPKGGDHDAER